MQGEELSEKKERFSTWRLLDLSDLFEISLR